MMRAGKLAIRAMATVGLLGLAACSSSPPEPKVVEPYQPIHIPEYAQAEANGSIFQAQQGYVPLFEDQRPRRVGDVITIVLEEQVSATKNSSSQASRSSNMGLDLEGLPEALEQLAEYGFTVGSANDFAGSGGSSASNQFSGIITVQVTQVLTNGNLRVRGEKQLAINQGTEYIRFSGIVNPRSISGQNSVTSTAVAEARLEYLGDGYITEAQQMGWLQRFFNYIAPF
ncbi:MULTISPECIES: flagellar basal body L-ring protein FlgH [Pseudidiomarina]|uniref:Flagellar L-ring protein n=2 Tax=Pseudidiomarina TaxID=2800384 RepID=A0A368UWE2_9GAMM|nr:MULTISPECIES: flagellar basal body L-ring protein FlgH [Pseudidiomarina]MDX1526790.1 flagellar basal body L-ring protein FlgH [Pseudidiomarina maritima]PWW13780.1 flagellar L-ring protein precursor FlgH [Pseudidiomarina maritima]RBP91174.1 flagellar L-ring protein precursor FlgH [Pseudidiomarina tainanensis]RCW33188.1 flagellar L-ring protein precursor FlgH [Pseudidiomarina tainanensis]